MICLSTKDILPDFKEFRRIAMQCLNIMKEREIRLYRNNIAFMQEYETFSHMTPADPIADGQRNYFLLHYNVLKAFSIITKLRSSLTAYCK